MLDDWDIDITANGRPTHRDAHGGSNLDFIATDAAKAALWTTELKWYPDLSDHALLQGRAAAKVQSSKG